MVGTSDPMPEPSPIVDTEPTNTPDQFSFKDATFDQVLEELSSRFILNLPEDELAEVERVCFQVEQAHWYYEDFIREEKPSFPSLPLKRFSEILFHSCPLLHHWSHDHETAFNGFMNYKTRVPVCGAIMLNESLTKCVLVKGWKSSAGWGFPKGKVNENEDEAFCAVREVLEETGCNLQGQIRRTDCIRLCIKQQPITLFVVPGIPEDFPFKTQTRKEISKIDWFKLADLPTWKKNVSSTNKFYLITPVIGPLKAIVRSLRRTRKVARQQQQIPEVIQAVSTHETEDQPIDDAIISITAESPVTLEPSSRSQSGEVEVSSSQSSSIDPHTPSVNGDLAPHTSDDTLVVKHEFSTDVEDIALDTEMGVPIGTMSSGLNADPRSHWSRLMTRLNHSEESSPRGTPQALTPTPPSVSNPIKSEPQPTHGSPPDHARMSGSMSVGSSNQEDPGVIPHRTLRKHPNIATRSSSVYSLPFHQDVSGISTTETPLRLGYIPPTMHQTPSSPDVLVKRTRQLQLLDSVLAEDSARRTPQPPMSAHILGAYPYSSNGLLPDHVHAPIRPASVNPNASRSQSTPFHHQPKYSISALSGVLPALAPASLQHQFIRPPQGHFSQHPLRSNALTTDVGRPATATPPHLASHPIANSTPYSRTAIDSSHRGQMLSILSGGASMLRSSTTGPGFRPASALRDTAAVVSPSSHSSFSSTSVGPRNTNSYLLSILNNSSGQVNTAPVSVQTRQ